MLIPVERAIVLGKELRRYEELENQFKQITGYNFEALMKLVAMGWTLEPPKEQPTLLEALVELNIEG